MSEFNSNMTTIDFHIENLSSK